MARISKAKREEEKIKAIEQHHQYLEKIFETKDEKRRLLILSLIDEASFMYVTLKDLKQQINRDGIKEKYKNGSNQWGYKDSTEVKTYNTMIKNYTSVIKQLNDIIPTAKKINPEDEFDSFNNLK